MRFPTLDDRQAPVVWSVLLCLGFILSIVGWLRWAG
jgi:hypothetical protein